jgi:Tol biopolymer transport system component
MWWKIAAGVLAIAVLTGGVFAVFRWPKRDSRSEHESLTPVPFTTFPGQETAPAISPDGSRIAFSWNGDPGPGAKGFDLYVKAIGSETLLRLTHHPATWISPAWSSDGTRIAFHRLDGDDTGIYVVPALGGPERKLISTRIVTSSEKNPSLSIISWSPDGKWIAYGDFLPGKASLQDLGIFFLATDTLESKRLLNPPTCINTGVPVFSHKGEYVAFWCSLGMNEFGLYATLLPSGEPRMIASLHGIPGGLTWSADDRRLIYSAESGTQGKLIDVTVADGSFKKLAFAGDSHLPTISQRGDKLAYSLTSSIGNIWRRDLLHPESPAVEIVASTRSQYDPQFSPDGKQIAFASERSGVPGVWVSGEDGSNPVQISNPRYQSGSPQWSPDGKKMAFDSLPSDRWEIFVADVSEGVPRKLTTSVSGIARPHWSRDGKWIYFMSNVTGRMGVFRCPAQGGDAVALSKDNAGVAPQESFDGRTIYYASGYNKPVLKRVAQQTLPGTASEVDGLPHVLFDTAWTPAAGGIYFVPADSPRSLRYFDFATKQIRPVFEADTDFNGGHSGLSVSSDGRWILYSQDDKANGDIMLVDHFR